MSNITTFERTQISKDAKGSQVTYEILTDRIIQALNQGVVPWQAPYDSFGEGFPRNPITKTEYSGINLISLWMTGYQNPYWGTYKHVTSMKGTKDGEPFTAHVKKGEVSSIICYAARKELKTTSKKVVNGKEKETNDTYFLLKYYNVFNLEQCELPVEFKHLYKTNESKSYLTEDQRIKAGDQAVTNYCNREDITITREKGTAFYQSTTDTINTPPFDVYHLPERYYHSNYHEMAHSTGVKKRLNRPELVNYGMSKQEKAQEELIADITACFMDSYIGTIDTTLKYSTDYINNWVQYFKDHPKAIVSAASKAQKAFEFIRNGTKSH